MPVLTNFLSVQEISEKDVNDKIRMYKKWNLKMYKICTK